MDLDDKTIAMIGSGYIGQALLNLWKGQGYHLIATTTSEEKRGALAQMADEAIVMKTSETEKLASVLERADACVITLAPRDGTGYSETYLKSAEDIAHLLQHRKRPLHLIYTSSISVYGKPHISPVTEDLPLHPETDNQRILAATEETYLGIQNPLVGVTVLRLGGIFGPGRDLSSRAARLLTRPMPGTGEEKTNHTHLDDIIGAIDFCLRNGVYGAYNLTMDAHPTRRELYGKLAIELSLPQPKWDPALPSAHGIGMAVDSSKLKAKGYSFAHDKLFASE
ncbi:NAD-dependent epimerase/dehydratase family protein [Estrella lausannensis]|uniref:NAD dependent epimerase/dehydratase n=1 Tax=Estrella lausannensis TaxID=483423 RepID=A0A0H5E4T8_9BACT|nr:NAD-dependent epimerase/dehydratase family protein [Estrella lausannensis]CRX38265.1 NAD dependent epimerase/dehydratase [Estrella lausannensis]